jgi:hypothetical protein
MPTFNGDHIDANHVRLFTNKLTNLEKLHINILHTHETTRT